MKEKPNLSFWGLWNLSFGFFGVQIAYALQSANISESLPRWGADPHKLSYFWILPPLMGIIVQPIVGILFRQDLVPLRSPHPLSVYGCRHCRAGDVSAAELRFVWHDRVWTAMTFGLDRADVSRHLY
jgi:hypothetical protein